MLAGFICTVWIATEADWGRWAETQCRHEDLPWYCWYCVDWRFIYSLKHGFDGRGSRGLARISEHFWVSLVGHTWCVQSSWQLVCLSVHCGTSVSGSAEPNGFSVGTPGCVLQHTGPCICWWPIYVDVLPHLNWTWMFLFSLFFCFDTQWKFEGDKGSDTSGISLIQIYLGKMEEKRLASTAST